ncbi:MAG TPA: ATP-binding protein [Telmatospirillum sp.]|nr:ATP-binding protein [Telmatospirillum sp.]
MGRLFWKLFLSFWLAMMLSFVAAITYLTLSGHEKESDNFPGLKAGFMMTTAQTLLTQSGPDALLAVLPRWNAAAEPPHLILLDAGKELLPNETLPDRGSRREVLAADGKRYILITDIPAIEEPDRAPSPAVPMISGAVIAFLFSIFLAWYLSRPLHHLRWALHSVAQGNLATRVWPRMGTRRDEIVDLGRDFDSMAARLQHLEEARQRLLHDLSHELRSPLTRMQAAIGLLRQSPSKTDAMLERIDREADRLNSLVEEVLTLARLEVGADLLARERVDLIELLSAIVEDAAFEAEAAGRAVHFSDEGQFVSTVNGEVLCRAFENIIRNAVKFTAAGTAVDIHATPSPDGQWLHVSVEDHGPGVPADMLDRIFEPFLRVETVQPGPGFGLGLAIARRAILSHGGQIHAEAGSGGGLRVSISLPAVFETQTPPRLIE